MDDYARRGYGAAGVGYGARIGIAVVDFQLAFTSKDFPMGGAALTERAVQNTATLLGAARAVTCRSSAAIPPITAPATHRIGRSRQSSKP